MKENLCYFLLLRRIFWHKINHTTWQIIPAEIAAKSLKVFWEEVSHPLPQTPSCRWPRTSLVKGWWSQYFCPFPYAVLFFIHFPLQEESRPQFLSPEKQTLQSNHDTSIYNFKRQDQVHMFKKYLFGIFQSYNFIFFLNLKVFDCCNKEWPWYIISVLVVW